MLVNSFRSIRIPTTEFRGETLILGNAKSVSLWHAEMPKLSNVVLLFARKLVHLLKKSPNRQQNKSATILAIEELMNALYLVNI